jgi:hypothetical protein
VLQKSGFSSFDSFSDKNIENPPIFQKTNQKNSSLSIFFANHIAVSEKHSQDLERFTRKVVFTGQVVFMATPFPTSPEEPLQRIQWTLAWLTSDSRQQPTHAA